MEKVWEELKKIEAQAEQIRAEAQDKGKEISKLAEQDAEKLLANSKAYAQEDAEKVVTQAVTDANRNREKQLQENEQVVRSLKEAAEKRLDKAEAIIVDAVLGKKKLD
jgi:vacuolar-type H+-ATPase subunit H